MKIDQDFSPAFPRYDPDPGAQDFTQLRLGRIQVRVTRFRPGAAARLAGRLTFPQSRFQFTDRPSVGLDPAGENEDIVFLFQIS